MIKTSGIIMKGEQHIVYVDRDRFPEIDHYPVEIDRSGRQIIYFDVRKPGKPYKLTIARMKRPKKVYEYGQIGLHPEFLSRNGLKKGDKVRVDYRKDRIVISKEE